MNLDTVLQGLAITVVGMGLVFLALGLIVLAMILMGRLLRPRPTDRDGTPQPEAGPSERAMVAAMVAAIVMAEAEVQSSAPGAWELAGPGDAPSPWQASHRSRALSRHS